MKAGDLCILRPRARPALAVSALDRRCCARTTSSAARAELNALLLPAKRKGVYSAADYE